LIFRHRTDDAAQLSLGQASIKELADMLGFSSPFHLSREFKRRFGVPPSAMRSHPPSR
jgi:AraC-like DNA-binding protein